LADLTDFAEDFDVADVLDGFGCVGFALLDVDVLAEDADALARWAVVDFLVRDADVSADVADGLAVLGDFADALARLALVDLALLELDLLEDFADGLADFVDAERVGMRKRCPGTVRSNHRSGITGRREDEVADLLACIATAC
jgi:hypothetical protein